MSSPPSSWCARGAIAIEALSAQSGSWPVDETSGVYGHARIATGTQYATAAALATDRFIRHGNKADAEVARECGALAARLAPTARAAWLYIGETCGVTASVKDNTRTGDSPAAPAART